MSETTRTLVMERELRHSQEKVWRALTEGALIEQWLMKNDFAPEVGRGFQLRSTPMPGWDGIIEGTVLAVEPKSRLSYTWGTLGMESVVTFTLTPTETGTLLRMEHAGFKQDQDANYKGASYGWKGFLGKLESVLEGMA